LSHYRTDAETGQLGHYGKPPSVKGKRMHVGAHRRSDLL
jgi:hypothetical protein